MQQRGTRFFYPPAISSYGRAYGFFFSFSFTGTIRGYTTLDGRAVVLREKRWLFCCRCSHNDGGWVDAFAILQALVFKSSNARAYFCLFFLIFSFILYILPLRFFLVWFHFIVLPSSVSVSVLIGVCTAWQRTADRTAGRAAFSGKADSLGGVNFSGYQPASQPYRIVLVTMRSTGFGFPFTREFSDS
ncbi:hypothetical protein V8F33_011045 [Rhypophila sp. PSN 637]